MELVSRQDVDAAAVRLAGRVHRTPMLCCGLLDGSSVAVVLSGANLDLSLLA